MNDPGLDEPIKETAKGVEDDTDEDGVEDEQAFLRPSRWWFASTAFPLIAGTFGPMASAFNICAIAAKWRVTVDLSQNQSEGNGDPVPDPEWLVAVNAVSLVFAIGANLALLFNMARRVSFSIAQPITIVGFYMASFILIGIVIAAAYAPSMQLPPEQNPAFTQAFWYAVLASGVYFVIASLMAVTVYGAYRGHYPRDFELTMSQRTLMIQTMAYMVYLVGGGAVFAHFENWLFLDGVWVCNYTLMTYENPSRIGDFQLITIPGRALMIPYSITGIVILGLIVGSIRSMLLDRGKRKVGARMVEKKRERVVEQLRGAEKKSELKLRLGPFTKPKINMDEQRSKPEIARRRQEFRLMRAIQDRARKRQQWTSFTISILAAVSLWLVGAAFFWLAERYKQPMNYWDAVWFAFIALLTIGYGDISLVSNAGKPIFVLWSLCAVPTLTILISNMGDTVIAGIRDLTLWFGAITILPDQGSTRERLKKGAQRVRAGKMKKRSPTEEPPGGTFLPESERKNPEEKHEEDIAHFDAKTATAADILGQVAEKGELDEAYKARIRGDTLAEDVHLHHYLLAREIRRVMKDTSESPPKKYSYREWAWFMKLLGEDERDKRFHKKPSKEPPPSNSKLQSGPSSPSNKDEIAATSGGDGSGSGDAEDTQWSWVGIRSPLLGDKDEPQWVLERLAEKLETGLTRQNEQDQAIGRDAATKGKTGRGSRVDNTRMDSDTTTIQEDDGKSAMPEVGEKEEEEEKEILEQKIEAEEV